jgi:hypothetical protein
MTMIGTAKEIGLQTFQDENVDLLLSFNKADVLSALDAWESVYGRDAAADVDDFVVGYESAFVVLVNRGAIERVRPLSTAGEEQWQKLISTYRI